MTKRRQRKTPPSVPTPPNLPKHGAETGGSQERDQLPYDPDNAAAILQYCLRQFKLTLPQYRRLQGLVDATEALARHDGQAVTRAEIAQCLLELLVTVGGDMAQIPVATRDLLARVTSGSEGEA